MSITAAQASAMQSAAISLKQMVGGIYPTAVTNPRGLMYDDSVDYRECSIDNSPNPVISLEIPGLNSVRQKFYESMMSDPLLYPVGRKPLVSIHRRMQTTVDEAVMHAKKVAGRIRNSSDYYYEIPRAADAILDAFNDSYGFLRSAVLLLTPSQYNGSYRHLIERARDQLKEAAKRTEDGPDARAMLFGAAWAAHRSTSHYIWKIDKRGLWYYGGNFELLGDQVVGAWQDALLPKPGMDDAYRILAGLQACMSRGRYARMAPFLDRLTMLFPQYASENKLRLAWAMIAEANKARSKRDAKDALRSAKRLIRSVISLWKQDDSRAEQVTALREQAREIGRLLR